MDWGCLESSGLEGTGAVGQRRLLDKSSDPGIRKEKGWSWAQDGKGLSIRVDVGKRRGGAFPNQAALGRCLTLCTGSPLSISVALESVGKCVLFKNDHVHCSTTDQTGNCNSHTLSTVYGDFLHTNSHSTRSPDNAQYHSQGRMITTLQPSFRTITQRTHPPPLWTT